MTGVLPKTKERISPDTTRDVVASPAVAIQLTEGRLCRGRA